MGSNKKTLYQKGDFYGRCICNVKNRGGGINSDDVTATRDKILTGYTALTSDSGDEPVSGTMPNHGAVSQMLGINGTYTIPAGYHNGVGKVTQSIPVFGGQTITPTKSAQTVSCSGKYASGNVIVNSIPSNFTDLTGGRVGFNLGTFQSPLDGGVSCGNDDGKYIKFRGVVRNDVFGVTGIVTEVIEAEKYAVLFCNHSVNLTGVSRIELEVQMYGYTTTEVTILDINKKTAARSNIVNSGDTTGSDKIIYKCTVDVSALNGHHFIKWEHESYYRGGYHTCLVRKVTFY